MKSGTILIYEPDSELSKSLTLVLEDDFIIITASALEEAVKNAIEHKVDILILDLNPDEMKNRAQLDKIHKKSPDTKIILLYVYTESVEEPGQSIRDAADAVLYKPLEINHFINIVRSVNN